ncbi:RNA polymerase II accessory factor, Cdc73 [Carpediemonas membranifera]|uniref:RNA polymerase II accessory factor, Cdc73 n=1 Tax=Carpediemonas membranifera TaxID=201153 RepID=A0A8J6BAN3_9EUKA|nr:RNA polymerase II accessory factor, Cdc73 [Carpediemonas membranifera]|eukprot:KAG9396272.1 RNA polymerase II accessory factor, Cdc73 [Carpediemonas membranifera]
MPSKIYTVKASVNKAIGEINGGGDNNAPRRGNLEPGMRSFTQAKYTFTCLLATVNLFDQEVLKQIVSIAQQKVSKAKAADWCRAIALSPPPNVEGDKVIISEESFDSSAQLSIATGGKVFSFTLAQLVQICEHIRSFVKENDITAENVAGKRFILYKALPAPLKLCTDAKTLALLGQLLLTPEAQVDGVLAQFSIKDTTVSPIVGGLERIPVAHITNLTEFIDDLLDSLPSIIDTMNGPDARVAKMLARTALPESIGSYMHVNKDYSTILQPPAQPGQKKPTPRAPPKEVAAPELAGRPIIVVPPVCNSMFNILNAATILSSGKFIPATSDTQPAYIIKHGFPGSRHTARFELCDSPKSLAPEAWSRVVAVFAVGQAWQFRGCKAGYGDPTFLFSNKPGFHICSDVHKVSAQIRSWNVKLISTSTLGLTDGLNEFWNRVQQEMARNPAFAQKREGR